MVPAMPRTVRGRTDGQTHVIRGADGEHGSNLCGRTLGIGQVVLADFFTDVTTIRFQPTMVRARAPWPLRLSPRWE